MLGRQADRALLDSPQTCHDHTSLRFSYAPGHPSGAAGRATTIWPQLSLSVWDAAILRRSVWRRPPPERGGAVQDLNTSQVGAVRPILPARRWLLRPATAPTWRWSWYRRRSSPLRRPSRDRLRGADLRRGDAAWSCGAAGLQAAGRRHQRVGRAPTSISRSTCDDRKSRPPRRRCGSRWPGSSVAKASGTATSGRDRLSRRSIQQQGSTGRGRPHQRCGQVTAVPRSTTGGAPCRSRCG